MGTTIKVMLNTDRALNNGSYPLVVRVIHNRRKKIIYTPYHLFQSDFDSNTQRVPASAGTRGAVTREKVYEINRYLREKLLQLERIVIQLEKNNGVFTVDDIVGKLKVNQATKFVFSYFEREIESMRQAGRFGSVMLYTSTLNSLKRFTGDVRITFSDVNYRFISNYVAYMQGAGACRNTINMYLRNLRTIYNKAQKEGVFYSPGSPFGDFKIGVAQTVKRSLSKDTIRRIAYADFTHTEALSLVRDVFMFSFYTRGMSLVDMVYLRHSNIVDDTIYYRRNKTGQQLQIAVTPPLRDIIERYRGASSFVLPFLKEDVPEGLYKQYRKALNVINYNLKRIGMLLNIEQMLTTYVARHSWATIAKAEGISIATISEGLGHTTEKTTQIYLRAFDRKTIDDANAKIIKL